MKRNTLRDDKKKKEVKTIADLLSIYKTSMVKRKERSHFGILMKKTMDNFLEGYGSILNISGIDQTPDPYFASSDRAKIQGDWENICNDLRVAMVNYDKILVNGNKEKTRK